MAQHPITRVQFEAAVRRVRFWETLVGGLAVCAAGSLLAFGLFGTDFFGLGPEIRPYARESGILGAVIGGVAISVIMFGTLGPAAFLSVCWADRKFGLRCPNCGRSITSIWHHRAPTQAGECRSCKFTLFEARSAKAAPDREGA